MATNLYFNNYGSHSEQRIIEDLIVESIKIMGFDAFYIPNDNNAARDLLYGEDPTKRFTSSFPLELYLSSSSEYMGDKEFFTKFGLEIRNSATVILSKRTFSQRVPQNTFTRPREGDLIYVPFLNGTGELFEIKFTNQTKDFFMLGRKVPYFYELELEKFKYSQEVITTGTEAIDSVVTDSAYTLALNTGSGTGTYLIKELVYQSIDNTYANSTTVGTVQSWTPSSNTLTVTNIAGVFNGSSPVIGQTSNARYTLVSFDPLLDSSPKENYDNEYIQVTANTYVDTTETNPIGSI
jgi:hypothetical protein